MTVRYSVPSRQGGGSYASVQIRLHRNNVLVKTQGNYVSYDQQNTDVIASSGWQNGQTAKAELWLFYGGAFVLEASVTQVLGSNQPGGGGPPSAIPEADGGPKHWRRQQMYFGDAQRDIQLVKLGVTDAFATNDVSLAGVPDMRSDGLIHVDNAELRLLESLQIAASESKSVGVYFPGPDGVGPDRTMYRVTGAVFSAHNLSFVMAIGPAAPSSAAAGESLALPLPLESSVGGLMILDEFVAVDPFGSISGTDYSGRPLAFGVIARNFTSAAVTALVEGHVSIQRLVGPTPRMIDRRIR